MSWGGASGERRRAMDGRLSLHCLMQYRRKWLPFVARRYKRPVGTRSMAQDLAVEWQRVGVVRVVQPVYVACCRWQLVRLLIARRLAGSPRSRQRTHAQQRSMAHETCMVESLSKKDGPSPSSASSSR